MDVEMLKRCGVDYERGVARFLGDRELYHTALGMFSDNANMEEARRACAARDYPALFSIVHALKGTCGNLDLADCYRFACELTELLRGGSDQDALIAEKFNDLQAAYQRVCDGIRAALE